MPEAGEIPCMAITKRNGDRSVVCAKPSQLVARLSGPQMDFEASVPLCDAHLAGVVL